MSAGPGPGAGARAGAEGRLRILYDGGCPICSREIDHYLRRDRGRMLEAIDISATGFDAARFGLEAERVRRLFHVVLPDGSARAGVDAFVEIWRRLPGPLYRALEAAARTPGVRGAMDLGYAAFARVRPWLPRRKGCDSGACRAA